MNRKNTNSNFFDAYVDLKKDGYILIFQKKCRFSQYFDGSGIKSKKSPFLDSLSRPSDKTTSLQYFSILA